MPTSVKLFDDRIEQFIIAHPYPNYIDIGPGEGRFGVMIHRLLPSTKVLGIEIDMSYVDKYGLEIIYDEIIVDRAINYFKDKESDNFDVIIMADVIEHMWKSEGLDLLHFLVYRSRFIIITYPTAYKQGAWEGHKSEAHLSTWAHKDFDSFENEHHVLMGDNNIQHNLVILKGFREE